MTPWIAIVVMVVVALVLILLESGEPEAIGHGMKCPKNGRPACASPLLPQEMALRIFSQQDGDFIRLTGSPRLWRIYVRERRKVALQWAYRTSRETRQIMRNHRLRSRESENLNAAVEAKLFFRYVELRLLCGALIVLIRLFGPHVLVNLAAHAGALSYRIGAALPATGFESETAPAGNGTL